MPATCTRRSGLQRPVDSDAPTSQDVATEPTMTLVEVMRLAAGRDGIAREYATGFEATFETGAPALCRARADGLSWDDAVVETFLDAAGGGAGHTCGSPRRRGGRGRACAARASRADGRRRPFRAGRLAIDKMAIGCVREPRHRQPRHHRGLTAAAIFVVLLGGGWKSGSR